MKKNLIFLTIVFIIIVGFNEAFGQCGPDGTQPCNSPAKNTNKKTTPRGKRSEVSSKSQNTAKSNVSSTVNNKVSKNKLDAEKYFNEYMKCKGNDYDCWITNLTKAIELNPNGWGYYSIRGNAYKYKADYINALNDHLKALELKPIDSTYRDLGDDYFHMKKYDEAIKAYSKAIELSPKVAYLYSDRGRIYRELGQTALAEADEKKYNELKKQ